jgi:solute carrier family 25 (mitochondrial aspartate/glutamate transporter), member 12/13
MYIDNSNNTFLTGLLAGLVGAFVVYPIDVVKTRMQNQTIPRIYTNGLDCCRKLWIQGRFKIFYNGCIIQMIGVGPEKAVKLFAYSTITSHYDKSLWSTQILGGIIAGACQVIITSPYEMVKINIQMNNKINYYDLFNFKKLYTGVSACFLRDVPFSGIYFPFYWYLKEKQDYNPFIAGSIACAPAAFISTPSDVIKTSIQTLKNKTFEPVKLSSIIKSIYHQEGLLAFWKGCGWRVIKSSPQFGITLSVFEYIK